jgi:hypothetical protein
MGMGALRPDPPRIKDLTIADRAWLLGAADRVALTRGAGVAFIGGQDCRVLRDPPKDKRLIRSVVIEADIADAKGGNGPAVADGARAPREPKVGKEAFVAFLSCGQAALGVAGIVYLTAQTGGLAAPALALPAAATAGDALQCGYALHRVWNEWDDQGALNDAYDTAPEYAGLRTTLTAIDVLGLVNGGVEWNAARKVHAAFDGAGFSVREARAGVTASRQQRKTISTALGAPVVRLSNAALSEKATAQFLSDLGIALTVVNNARPDGFANKMATEELSPLRTLAKDVGLTLNVWLQEGAPAP